MRPKKLLTGAIAANLFALSILGAFWVLFWPFSQDVTSEQREATATPLGLATIALLLYMNTSLQCDRLEWQSEVIARLDRALFQLYQEIWADSEDPFEAYFAWKYAYVREHGTKKIAQFASKGTLPGMDDLSETTPHDKITEIQDLIKKAING